MFKTDMAFAAESNALGQVSHVKAGGCAASDLLAIVCTLGGNRGLKLSDTGSC